MGRNKDIFVGRGSESVRAAKEVDKRFGDSGDIRDAERNGATVPLIEFALPEVKCKKVVLKAL